MICLYMGLSCFEGALAAKDRLVVVTSFPDTVYAPIVRAFADRYTDVSVKILNKKTSAALAFVQRAPRAGADLFWASAPDAFEILKYGGLLAVYRPRAVGIPERIGPYPIHDPDGYYSGFAVSGYGMMWNRDYLAREGLPEPRDWRDLGAAAYYRHIGMSTPSRSGTTHLAVETILQTQGWRRGWATLLEMGGNLATVTARSYGVPDGVAHGRFGIGVVIDFFALAGKARGLPVAFNYPPGAPFLPASIALLKGAPNPHAAQRFIEFLLSADGQALLLDPAIMRLPVRPETYALAPSGFPNPFVSHGGRQGDAFDAGLSKQRYQLVNALFDELITYRVKALNKTWAAIHALESQVAIAGNATVRALAVRARQAASGVPVTAGQAADQGFAGQFQYRHRGRQPPAAQASLESAWRDYSRQRLGRANALVDQARSLLAAGTPRS